ncbi:hypothetical protein C7271_17510 [filamentous cyanobacterium CCP5]|nr:hypothetical protein C7271_17510 [filamentous cyanobacterium CCP5]
MKQQRLTAYLNLIQELLTCPQGEEWIRLKGHEDLVDAQLLQVMEEVAAQLARQGDRETATFLHNWAAKLHHILLKDIQPTPPAEDKSEIYLDVIQKLLSCPEGAEAQVLASHQALIGPGLGQKMHEVAQQLIHQGEDQAAQYLEGLAHQLNQQWFREHNFPARLQKAPVSSSPAASPAVNGSDPPSSVAGASQSVRADAELEDPWDITTGSAGTADTAVASPGPWTQPAVSAPTNGLRQPQPPAIAAELKAIAAALQDLAHALADTRSPHPLWYLDVLEQACTRGWQLTTEEVEQLIGVKPHCEKGEMVYQRGSWRFTKVGRLGVQTAWQVSKAGDHLG